MVKLLKNILKMLSKEQLINIIVDEIGSIPIEDEEEVLISPRKSIIKPKQSSPKKQKETKKDIETEDQTYDQIDTTVPLRQPKIVKLTITNGPYSNKGALKNFNQLTNTFSSTEKKEIEKAGEFDKISIVPRDTENRRKSPMILIPCTACGKKEKVNSNYFAPNSYRCSSCGSAGILGENEGSDEE